MLLLVMVSFEAKGAEVFLIPEANPKPDYPKALSRAGIAGSVRVSFYANADGSVSDVKILQSDHPDLAEATKVAIAKWRFKPWVVEGDRPARQEVIAPMVFGLEAPSGINAWLKELKCREVNEGLVRAAEQSWPDLPAFQYTRAYLSSGLLQVQMSNEERLGMIARLNRQVPVIARQCLNNPIARFARYLPQNIRELL
ncbi:energy transducer TonB [Pseudomonas sp. LB3P31]